MWPGPVRRLAARASTCWPASTSRCSGWAWTTSTSSTATASTRTRRWRRRWARWTPPSAQGKALYAGISSYSAGAHPRGGGDPARAGHAAADPPAVLLDAQPLDRGRACSTPLERRGRRLHRVLAAGAGHADRQVPRRHPGGLAGAPGQRRWPRTCSPRRTLDARPRAERDRRAAAGSRWRRWRWPGRCATSRVTSALIGASSVRAARGERRGAGQPRLLRRRAGRDRPARGRRRHQHLGGVQRGLTAPLRRGTRAGRGAGASTGRYGAPAPHGRVDAAGPRAHFREVTRVLTRPA